LRRGHRPLAAVTLGVALTGCFGSPSPLAPGLHGSVGLPNQGVLTEGLELPVAGFGYTRYRQSSSHYFGVPRLIAAIEKAAADVARESPGGAPLFVGDLSAKTGGKIPNHASHRTGRDVDLLYFITTVHGKPENSPGFIAISDDGLGQVPADGHFFRLDEKREWQLVRSLLTNPRIEVLWMFVSRDVEAMIITQARSLGEPNELVWRAEQVLHQPRDSAPHDDHMHLRIACTESELLNGCEGGGPHWPWFDPKDSNEVTDAALAQLLASEPSPDEPQRSNESGLSSNASPSVQ
jgi:penicillin-insensitive murein endopeptidase